MRILITPLAIVLSILLPSANSIAQDYEQNCLEWGERELLCSDFRICQHCSIDSLKFFMGIQSYVEYGKVVIITDIYLPASEIPFECNDKILEHIKLLFDIGELQARNLRKRASILHLSDSDEYDIHYREANHDFFEMRNRCTKSTDFGNKKRRELRWRKRVNRRLKVLEEYIDPAITIAA